MRTDEDGGRSRERERANAGLPASKPAGEAPSAMGPVRESWDVETAMAVSARGRYSLEVDESTHMEIQLWHLPATGELSAKAVVSRGSLPPFAAVGEVTGWGVRFFARPRGAPVPLRERAVHVVCSSVRHPTVQLVDVLREYSAAPKGEGT